MYDVLFTSECLLRLLEVSQKTPTVILPSLHLDPDRWVKSILGYRVAQKVSLLTFAVTLSLAVGLF